LSLAIDAVSNVELRSLAVDRQQHALRDNFSRPSRGPPRRSDAGFFSRQLSNWHDEGRWALHLRRRGWRRWVWRGRSAPARRPRRHAAAHPRRPGRADRRGLRQPTSSTTSSSRPPRAWTATTPRSRRWTPSVSTSCMSRARRWSKSACAPRR